MSNETTTTTRFKVGQTYMTRSIGDWNCKVIVTIAKRTAKFVTTTDGKRFGVRNWDKHDNKTYEVVGQVEHIHPWGRYSMCPIIGADQRIAAD